MVAFGWDWLIPKQTRLIPSLSSSNSFFVKGIPNILDDDNCDLLSRGIISRPGFVQHLTNMINKHLGKTSNAYVEFEPVQAEGVEICLCSIRQAESPIFLNKDGEKKFFIRAHNTCQPLDSEEAHRYIIQHWDYSDVHRFIHSKK